MKHEEKESKKKKKKSTESDLSRTLLTELTIV